MQFIGCLVMAVYGVAQLVAAWVGLEWYVGAFLAVVIFVACLWFQFTIPLTIASFFGAMEVWEWHWFAALAFAAPGLLLAVPALLASALELVRDQLGRRHA